MVFNVGQTVRIANGAGFYNGKLGVIKQIENYEGTTRILLEGQDLSGAVMNKEPILNSRYVLESMIEAI